MRPTPPTQKQKQPAASSDQASKVQRSSELAKITELNISSGIKFVKASTVTAEALVAALSEDAQTATNCKPYGKPDFSLLLEQLKPTLDLAQSEKTANADMNIVEQGVSLSTYWVDQGMRAETQPMGSWSRNEASLWDMKTSWPLGAQIETTRDKERIGKSNYDVQKGPYVCDTDGGTVATYKTGMVEVTLLASDPTRPKFTSVHMNDVCVMTPYDENVQVGSGSQPTTYKEPPGTDNAARACAHVTVLPTLVSREKAGALAQGDSQMPALKRLVDDGKVLAVLHAGPATYSLLGKSVAQCEFTPGQRDHKFGLKLVQMSDGPAKLYGIVVSSPKLYGPNAEPDPAVQTSMGVINCLRRISGFDEIAVESSPLWGRTVHATLDELTKLQKLMPRLSAEFERDNLAQKLGGDSTTHPPRPPGRPPPPRLPSLGPRRPEPPLPPRRYEQQRRQATRGGHVAAGHRRVQPQEGHWR